MLNMIAKSFTVFYRPWKKIPIGYQTRQFSLFGRVRAKEVWDLVSAVCVERRPILTTSLTEFEIKFQKLLQDIEFENSYKSDHEIRKLKERKQAELLKKGELSIDEDIAMRTAQDLEDAYQEEYSKFQFLGRTTEADENKDFKSLDRVLDKYLVLVVNQKIGDSYQWILPQGLRENGETMRQTAERVLEERCGANLQTQFLGNAPCGFYKYKYSSAVRKEVAGKSVGAKIFFYKAWHLGGQVECNKSFIKDYKWSDTEDLISTLKNDIYYNSVSRFLINQ